MRWSWFGVVGVLVVSLALNVWQWRRPAVSTEAQHAPAQAVGAPPRGGPGVAGAAGKATEADSPVAGSCPSQLAKFAERLANAETELEKHRPLEERFETAPPNPAREVPIRAQLAKLFSDAPKGWSWNVECRGATCKLDVVGPERGPEYDWMAKLQQDDGFREQFDRIGFQAGTPSKDPASKDAVITQTALLGLPGVETVSGHEILQRIEARFRADPATRSCATREEGYLSLQLRIEPPEQRVQVAVGGTFADTPVGDCLLRALDAAIAADPVPPNARLAVSYVVVEVPFVN